MNTVKSWKKSRLATNNCSLLLKMTTSQSHKLVLTYKSRSCDTWCSFLYNREDRNKEGSDKMWNFTVKKAPPKKRKSLPLVSSLSLPGPWDGPSQWEVTPGTSMETVPPTALCAELSPPGEPWMTWRFDMAAGDCELMQRIKLTTALHQNSTNQIHYLGLIKFSYKWH